MRCLSIFQYLKKKPQYSDISIMAETGIYFFLITELYSVNKYYKQAAQILEKIFTCS